MPIAHHAFRVLLARGRARRQASRNVKIGRNARFGRAVTCRTEGTGRVVLGRNVEIAPHCSLSAAPGATLEVGDDVFIGGWCQLAAKGHISIGAGSMIAEYVTLRDHDHDPALPPRSGRMLQSDIHVGRRVWLGAKASVGRGVSIGDDAVVAAHAFVSREVPPRALVGGVPARVIRREIKTAPLPHDPT